MIGIKHLQSEKQIITKQIVQMNNNIDDITVFICALFQQLILIISVTHYNFF